MGVRTLRSEPGIPCENGCLESFHGQLRDDLLDQKISDTLPEAKVLLERWRREYNTVRPNSSLGIPAPSAGSDQALEEEIPAKTLVSIVGAGNVDKCF